MVGLSQCHSCVTAASVLRRLGFRDTITWGPIVGSPNLTSHGWHSNSGEQVTRVETRDEYYRRTELRKMSHTGGDDLPFGQMVSEYSKHPLCQNYRSELAWLAAGRPTRTTVYLAHPVSDNFGPNITNAIVWFRHLRGLSAYSLSELVGVQYDYKPLILCPWLSGIQPDEESPGGREQMLADCRDTVMMFDEVWLLWRITDGMRYESGRARVVRDLTHLGKSPPMAKVLPFDLSGNEE